MARMMYDPLNDPYAYRDPRGVTPGARVIVGDVEVGILVSGEMRDSVDRGRRYTLEIEGAMNHIQRSREEMVAPAKRKTDAEWLADELQDPRL